jgi:dethiobiotin synthetase
MLAYPPRGLFVTGTNTEVGKTYIAALIARSLVAAGRKVAVYKPVASGCSLQNGNLVADDAVQLWEGSGRHGTLQEVCPQRYLAPIAPHRAAASEGKRVDAQLLRSGLAAWTDRCEVVIVEGAGGLMSPMSDTDYAADLAAEFGYPLIVVAANALGVINQTLQTLLAAKHHAPPLPVAGVILNDVQPQGETDLSRNSNYEELASRCAVPVLDHVGYESAGFGGEVDWWQLAEAT